MPTVARLNDKGTLHDGYHETVITAGSPAVSVDGLPAARMGDPLTPHDNPKHPPPPRKIASGSGTVFIDGPPRPASRL
ncbi:PAAR domain-containing protein [Salmonella bongori]|uniref:PAAR domain-containing protein n=1 Tax=Salmonella bongori TaxID=54736 RepID=UPI0009A990FB|nr:PAAR domain-containing protein [Salmonella bongori]